MLNFKFVSVSFDSIWPFYSLIPNYSPHTVQIRYIALIVNIIFVQNWEIMQPHPQGGAFGSFTECGFTTFDPNTCRVGITFSHLNFGYVWYLLHASASLRTPWNSLLCLTYPPKMRTFWFPHQRWLLHLWPSTSFGQASHLHKANTMNNPG